MDKKMETTMYYARVYGFRAGVVVVNKREYRSFPK